MGSTRCRGEHYLTPNGWTGPLKLRYGCRPNLTPNPTPKPKRTKKGQKRGWATFASSDIFLNCGLQFPVLANTRE